MSDRQRFFSRSVSVALVAWMSLAGGAALAHDSADDHDAGPHASESGAAPPFAGVLTKSDEGTKLQVLADSMVVKASPRDTGGAYAVIEVTSPPGTGSPVHTHAHEDEIFYVLEGELELRLGEKTWVAGPGATAVLPRGVAHAYRNVGEGPSRAVVVIAPGRFVEFFEKIDAIAKERPVTPDDAGRLATEHALEIHPPEE